MAGEIRIGVIGVGMIGKHHLKNYQGVPGAKVVAVSDVNAAEAQKVATEYGVAKVYNNFRELLKQSDIDAVDVCLHNNLHAPVTIEGLKAGKHVYCEKPIAGSYCDARAMVETSNSTGKKLHIQLSTLYSPEHKAARKLIEEGQLGKVYHARSVGFRRRGRPFVDGYGTPPFVQKQNSGGGAMFDMGVYHISQALHLLGNPAVETISGSTHQEIPMYEDRAKSSGYSVEELGLGFVRLAGGVTLAIEESWAMHYDESESMKILGSKGGIKLKPFTFFTTINDIEMNCGIESGMVDRRWHSCKPEYSAYDSSQHHWVAALQGTVPLLNTAEIALNTSLISEGIYQSQALKRELKASEVAELSKTTAIAV